jgi:hypothetical protein
MANVDGSSWDCPLASAGIKKETTQPPARLFPDCLPRETHRGEPIVTLCKISDERSALMTRAAKPPFSPWLVRRIPFLASAGENPAFGAFYDRRKRLSFLQAFVPALSFRKRSPLSWVVNIAIASVFLVPMALSGPFGSSRQWIILAILILAGLILLGFWLKGEGGKWMPHRLSNVFSLQSINTDVAFDLWQCGVSGRQIAEGLLLESLERAVTATIIALAVLTALCLAAVALPTPIPLKIGYAVIVILLGIVNFRTAILGYPCGATKDIIPVMIARWRQSDPLTAKLERGCQRFLRGLIYIPVTILVVAGAVGVGFLVVAVLRLMGLAESDSGSWMLAIIGSFYIYMTLCGMMFVALFRPWEAQRLEEMLSEADEAFDLFIRQEILHDPDARRSMLDTGDLRLSSGQKETAHPDEDARLS